MANLDFGTEPTFQEAVEDEHFAKVRHHTQKGKFIWKCLLHGCPRGKPYSLKDYLNNHWARDHPGCNLRLTVAGTPGPRPKLDSRTARIEELVKLCDKQSGFFPARWLKYKERKLASKIAEVSSFVLTFLSLNMRSVQLQKICANHNVMKWFPILLFGYVLQVVNQFLNDKLLSLDIGEDLGDLPEEPSILTAMRLIGHKYMPTWDKLGHFECKSWVLKHMRELLAEDGRGAQFRRSLEEWLSKTNVGRGRSQQAKREADAVAEVFSALKTDSEPRLNALKDKAFTYVQMCKNWYFFTQTNDNPNEFCNDRIRMKFLDYLLSSAAQADKERLGETVLKHRLERMKHLGVNETEATARTNVRCSS
jgi:hypothetical protein